MILLQASHIAKQFDGHEVLLDASVLVQDRDRVALIGPNGAGKSTLLKIIVGQLSPDSGHVSLAKDKELGYVSQFTQAEGETTVFDFVAETFAEVTAMELRMRDMEQSMSKPEIYENEAEFEALSKAYDSLRLRFEELNGYSVEARIRRVLDGLRFTKEMWNRPVSSLSGGQKTRLSLGRLLVSQPDILVLDEPTNYLDTDTLSWLEGYLQGYDGAVLVVSHDRYFLDVVITTLYELEHGVTTRYVGNYSMYIEEKAARLEADMKRYEAQQEEIQRMESFIQKNIVRATTTKRAQSRRKMLEKIVRLDRPSTSTPKMALQFACARESGKDVLRVENLTAGYPGKPMPGPLNLYVARGYRVALLGPNGIGKSTFLKTMMGRLPALGGSFQWGAHVQLGYYDQEQTDLDTTKTVLSQIWDEHPDFDITTVRTALGRFLFRGEDVEKPVAALSGGERSRLALCRLMLQQANVLIMDEPTNHLDLLSKEVLEDSLQDYEGTLLMVSHDRYFIDALATHILTLDEAGFTLYLGNYTDYMLKRADNDKWSETEEAESDGFAAFGTASRVTRNPRDVIATSAPRAQKTTLSPEVVSPEVVSPEVAPGQPSPVRRKVRSADIRKLRDKVAQLEQQIADVEAKQTAIGERFTDVDVLQNATLTMQLQAELADLEKAHADLLEAWESTAEELENLENLASET